LIADGYGDRDVEPVLFYHATGRYGAFSNFSGHTVELQVPSQKRRRVYATGEHRFQAMKAITVKDHTWVAKAISAFDAKKRGGPRGIELRDGWGNDYGDLCWYVMLELVIAKAQQHPEVLRLLRRTGDRPIYEDSPTDDIWGWRYREDYRGKNLLGRCWMTARDLLS
jgi:ribA/ribD-fused uncharacterized protein